MSLSLAKKPGDAFHEALRAFFLSQVLEPAHSVQAVGAYRLQVRQDGTCRDRQHQQDQREVGW